MTLPREPGAAQAAPAIVLADDTCTDVLSQVIAHALSGLPASRWLIPSPAARRRIFPGYIPAAHRARPGQRHRAHHRRPRRRALGCPPDVTRHPRP